MTAEEILRELLDKFHIGDYIYNVRENEGKGWAGIGVKRYAFLINEAEKLTRENDRPTV